MRAEINRNVTREQVIQALNTARDQSHALCEMGVSILYVAAVRLVNGVPVPEIEVDMPQDLTLVDAAPVYYIRFPERLHIVEGFAAMWRGVLLKWTRCTPRRLYRRCCHG